jgi:hypothetical protein
MYLDPKDPGTTVKKKHQQHFAVKLQNVSMVAKLKFGVPEHRHAVSFILKNV